MRPDEDWRMIEIATPGLSVSVCLSLSLSCSLVTGTWPCKTTTTHLGSERVAPPDLIHRPNGTFNLFAKHGFSLRRDSIANNKPPTAFVQLGACGRPGELCLGIPWTWVIPSMPTLYRPRSLSTTSPEATAGIAHSDPPAARRPVIGVFRGQCARCSFPPGREDFRHYQATLSQVPYHMVCSR